jgi:hypothetical protein
MVMDGCDKSVAELLMDRKAHSDLLKAKLAAAHNRMKIQTCKHRTDREFQVGEMVLVKLQPYA